MFQSYAQNGEDIVLFRALGHISHGTYVDVGAADPDDDSVTKAFYERGWSGVDIDPAPEHAARLREARTRDVVVEACAGDRDGSMTLHLVPGTGLSTVVDASAESLTDSPYEVIDVEVPIRRLDAILEEAGFAGRDIHFLKIDVEGFEETVIRGIDLERWRPWVVVAEATAPRSTEQVHHEWEPLLIAARYEFCLFDGLNRFYVAEEHAELRQALSAPACVFDHPYLTPPHAKLLDEYDNLLEGNQRLEATYRQTVTDYTALEGVYQKAIADYSAQSAELERTVADYSSLEATYQQTVADYSSLEATYRQTVADYSSLEATYQQTVADYERVNGWFLTLHHEREELQATLAHRGAEIETLRAGVAEMGAEFDGVRAARDAAVRELELTRQTLSWRVTRPLRLVRRLRAR